MEKKRRARINKCLDQLKTLLESYYTSNIRKRKLEKADILELTVKHLRSLQKMQSCTSKASGFSDYQAGFNSCLTNVHQYLSMVDTVNGSDSLALSQLVSKNVYSCAKGSFQKRDASRTLDSDAGKVVVEARDGPCCKRRLAPLPALNATLLDSRGTANMAAVGGFGAATTTTTTTTTTHHNTCLTKSLHYDTRPMVEVKAEGQSLALKQAIGILPGRVITACHNSPRNGDLSSIIQHSSMWRPW
ncbi:hypothetical protein NHX12_012550 [Muraenolepis orangiensis]|uniref:BHLH domain-containing protein n=1 Tax=Muraenolepis orangiensis TaxID=630683 RepID=A0A9Q0I4Z9_9TELE|nr:hypothetical protein NHX12_012550 [Muraenolepis orangiensis]